VTGASAVGWWFRSRETGRITVAQLPNLSLGIYLVAWATRKVLDPSGTLDTVLAVIAGAALLWWALDEVIRGVNPFRRVLGTAVLGWMVAGWLTG
jgi:hypothetical protein